MFSNLEKTKSRTSSVATAQRSLAANDVFNKSPRLAKALKQDAGISDSPSSITASTLMIVWTYLKTFSDLYIQSVTQRFVPKACLAMKRMTCSARPGTSLLLMRAK